jgi:hypothetical protein
VRHNVKIEYRYRRQRRCASLVVVHDTDFVEVINVRSSYRSPIIMIVHMASIGVGVGMEFDLLEAGCSDT